VSVGDVLVLVIPLILPVVIGWALVRTGLAEPSYAGPLTTVFLWVCAPAILIVTLAGEDLDDLLERRLLLGTVIGFVVVYAVVYAASRRRHPTGESAFAAFAASAFNAVALGLPVMIALFGTAGTVPAVVATIVFLALLVPTTLALAGSAEQGGAAAFVTGLAATVKNPIVLATIIGLVLAALDVTLPVVIDQSLTTLGDATVVTALVALGMSVDFADIRSGGSEMLMISGVRMIVAPAFALALALLFGVDDVRSAAFVVLFAQPTAKTVFALAEQTGVYERRAAGVVALTTISSALLLPAWILICDRVWPDAFT
jgi:malonate transporter